MTIKTERPYRNPFEEKIGAQLEAAGIKFEYEPIRLPVTIPERTAHYVPDFIVPGTNIVIEGKGVWGGGKVNFNATSAAARQKFLLTVEQHPELDFRVVYQNSKTKIYKGSPTSQGQWATDHDIPWSDKGVIPQAWLAEIKAQQEKANDRPRKSAGARKKGSPRSRSAD